ncbi:unnamed protein product, partial [Ectocarpus sp. 12 AP-2014]
MLRQGLVNPVDVIPQLLALGGDSAGFVRAEAFRPLTVKNSKNGELLRTRLSDGLFMAYTFQQHVLCVRLEAAPAQHRPRGGRHERGLLHRWTRIHAVRSTAETQPLLVSQ